MKKRFPPFQPSELDQIVFIKLLNVYHTSPAPVHIKDLKEGDLTPFDGLVGKRFVESLE